MSLVARPISLLRLQFGVRYYSPAAVAKKFIYVNRFDGLPKPSDFQLVEEPLGHPKDGEILVQAEYISVDPYQQAYMAQYPLGVDMIGGQIAKVLDSEHTRFPIGSYIFGQFGWRTHTLINPDIPKDKTGMKAYVLPNFGNLPLSLGLGYLGMPGNTAYFGLLDLCQPKAGETVVVTGAAGAVGSLVGQLAKIHGCKAIGFAGSDEKCAWLEKELGFDKAINYKAADYREQLKTAAPKGVDVFFDNVGGELSAQIIRAMRPRGRIAVCGAISEYSLAKPPPVPSPLQHFVMKQLKMEGFVVNRWGSRWFEGLEKNLKWIQEGKIKYHETVTDGFENLPQALVEMLRGKNLGKAVVKV